MRERNRHAPAAPSPLRRRVARAFRWHLLIYLLANAALTAANVYTGAPWWAVWPLIAWGLLLMLHFLFYRAETVDDAWVEERTLDLRSKSYDLGHIEDIREHPAPSIGSEGGNNRPAGRR